ncbi:MAG: aldo/keto reductase [Pirellulales bacterium]|nr:aldo/keto reductase [Pirellulales bacterium]
MEYRELGRSGLRVSAIAMGCWPISGMSSVDVSDDASVATLEAAVDCGVNFFDTAYNYGQNGESERLIARALGHRRNEILIATKAGLLWTSDRRQVRDARPETLRRSLDESLRRLGTDQVDVLFLHAPDPAVPLAETAGCFAELKAAGRIRAVGTSNLDVDQLAEFHAVCPIDVHQPAYNLLQREIELDMLPWCRERGVAVAVYWPLLKGLLAGRMTPDFVFRPGDGRAKYPMFQSPEFERNLEFVAALQRIADDAGRSVAQLVLCWTIHQPGITTALVGAKRPEQIRENAGGAGWSLSSEQLAAIDAALLERGPIVTRFPV